MVAVHRWQTQEFSRENHYRAMRLKFTFPPTLRHGDRVDCVGWMSADDLFSVGEDHVIYKYNIVQNELVKIAELAQDLYPLDMHWLPKGASSGAGQGSSGAAGGKRTVGSDLFVLATSDGRCSCIAGHVIILQF